MFGYLALVYHLTQGMPKLSSVLENYGEVITLDELTAKSLSFGKGRIYVAMEFLDYINEIIHLRTRNQVHSIRVIENPYAEKSWENRIVTTIGFSKDGKRMVAIEDVVDSRVIKGERRIEA